MLEVVHYERAEINPNWTKNDKIKALIHVIEVEQPIHIYELCSRVWQFYDGWKVTPRFRRVVELDLDSIASIYGVIRKGDFYQIGENIQIKARCSLRKIQHVPDEEIADALRKVMCWRRIQMLDENRTEIFRQAAILLGYFRLGSQIVSALDRVYNSIPR